ncbi:MAG: hypothetical protein IIV14_10325 [Bacteroidaceae bacterium]|jgi:hypothetical protein|nr:hypothetical protein [Bacteroidaceae bacterium]
MKFDAEVVVVCPFCHKLTTIQVVEEDYLAWKYDGVLIQNAMPYLPANVREMLISGLCDDCQAEMFSIPEDDEPDDIDDDCGFDPYEGCFTYDC